MRKSLKESQRESKRLLERERERERVKERGGGSKVQEVVDEIKWEREEQADIERGKENKRI